MRRERERKEDVSKMGHTHTHTHFYTGSEGENRFIDMYPYNILTVLKKLKDTCTQKTPMHRNTHQHNSFLID